MGIRKPVKLSRPVPPCPKRCSSLIIIPVILIIILGTAGCLSAQSSDRSVNASTTRDIPASPSEIHGSGPVTITQTDGTSVTLPCRPQRIIVANGNAAEMMIAIGAGDRIVGVTASTLNVSYIMDKIPQAENIGDWQVPNIERILALHPDVVIAYASSKPKNLDQFAAANVTILYLDCFRLSTLASDARALGVLTGKTNESEVYAQMIEKTVAEVKSRAGKIPVQQHPRVYSESYTDLTASGPGSGSDEMLTLAGGKNIAADIPASSAKISAEWVVARQPEYVLKVISSSNQKPFPEIAESMRTREGWSTIPAVENDRVFLFANDVQYGPRSYIGLVYTAKILHPELFRDMNPRQLLDEYARKYVAGTNISMPVYPERE